VIECEFCGETFVTITYLQRHENSHINAVEQGDDQQDDQQDFEGDEPTGGSVREDDHTSGASPSEVTQQAAKEALDKV